MKNNIWRVFGIGLSLLCNCLVAGRAQSPTEIQPGLVVSGDPIELYSPHENPLPLPLNQPHPLSQYITVGSPNGLKFNLNPTFDTTTTAGDLAYQGFQRSASRWSGLFADNITVNLNIGFADLGNPNIIGSTNSVQAIYSYSSVHTALINDSTSVDDASAVAHLQAGPNFTERINYTSNNPNGTGSAAPYTDSTGANTSNIRMSNANAKALGLLASNSVALDATITFNSTFAFDYNPDDGVDSDKIDFTFVATHEIGHALGFISGVDILDGNSPQGSTFFSDDTFTYVSTLDLYRFSADSVAVGNGVNDFTAGNTVKYFSLDGGATQIATFSNGVTHGEGRQASHWKDDLSLGIMDPTAAFGETGVIRMNDIRAFDVIGYDLAPTPEPPGPAAFGLGALGLAGLIVARRRRSFVC